MHDMLSSSTTDLLAVFSPLALWNGIWPYLLIFLGFSAVIFVHELGHFLAAKWAGVRVERFAIGFFRELVGFTWGETRYSFNILPLGGYVKMLGQEDFDDKENEWKVKDDPRAFTNKPVGKRMVIVSAGVVMNIIFAAMLFVVVFMRGQEEYVTTVGQVIPESPAARAGVLPGDTIVRINGETIREYNEIKVAVILADPHTPIEFEVDRNGKIESLSIMPEPSQQQDLLYIGITPATANTVVATFGHRFDESNPSHLQPGDTVVGIDGRVVSDDELKSGIERFLRSADGSPVRVAVERPNSKSPNADGDADADAKRIEEVMVFNDMFIDPADPFEDQDTRSLLGLLPLVRVSGLDSTGPAALGGIRENDVITKWGPHKYPTQRQITEVIRGSAKSISETETWRSRWYREWTGRDVQSFPVRVERAGQAKPVWLEVLPKIKKKGQHPYVGFGLSAFADDDMRVSGTLEQVHGRVTPAHTAGIRKGDRILAVNGSPVALWHELAERFRLLAGQSVSIDYTDAKGQPRSTTLAVPESLYTMLGLNSLANIISIDNERFVTVDGPKRRLKISAGFSYGLFRLLQKRLEQNGGQPTTVTVRYQAELNGPEKEADVTITPENVDPWVARIKYAPNVFFEMRMQMLKATGPVDALRIGIDKTVYFVLQVYTMLERMIVSRSVGAENMSGPVGIVKLGSDAARASFTRLLFFLAIISANLAVINFLPLPIMDGGLMVFLIIEKIKGSPVSLKVQVVTQMIGLVLIGAAFLFVTFNDVLRLAG